MFKIYLPLSKPSLATVSLFVIVNHWNAWFDGLIYMNLPERYPLMTYLQSVVLKFDITKITSEQLMLNPQLMEVTGRGIKGALILLCTVPILMIYPFLQKYFVSGVVMGSVKSEFGHKENLYGWQIENLQGGFYEKQKVSCNAARSNDGSFNDCLRRFRGEQEKAPAGSTAENEGGTDDVVELTYMHKLNGTEKYVGEDDINNNVYTRCYEDELGIKLNYTIAAAGMTIPRSLRWLSRRMTFRI